MSVTGNGVKPAGSPGTGEEALSVENLSSGYGLVQVLRDVNLSVPAGTITAVLGANGAGKTTLLRTLTGLVKPTAGRVTFEGTDLRAFKVEELVRRGIAHVPEGRGVVEELTVDENLRLGGLWRKDRADAQKATDEVYELFEPLARRRGHLGHQLSGGERQMLAVGRALIASPKLLLLDEPSLGLAPILIQQVFETIAEINQQGTTVLLVEQNALQALNVAHRGYVLQTGRVVLSGTGAELRENETVRKAYLGEI